MPRCDPAGPATRDDIRERVRRSRLARLEHPEAEQRADDQQRDARVLALVDSLVPPDAVVACYLSRAGEPGTLGLIARLCERGRVLVPKLGPRDDGGARRKPDWTWFDAVAGLVRGPFGIPDPVGQGLGAEALAQADLVIAAALSAGPDGSRIGTGGGWFDRALPLRRAGVPVVALLNDDEVLSCPQEPHDEPVDWLVTPTRTIRTSTGG